MSKCFITKLPSSVDNDNLPILGQLRISWLKQDNLTNNDARAIELQTNDSITAKVSGAHFTDNTLTSNVGNTKTITATDNVVRLYISNDADAVLTIDNKYSLSQLSFIGADNSAIYFDIEDIKYCTNLTNLRIYGTQVSGDISAISNLTKLTALELSYSQVSGDISVLSSLTNLAYIYAINTQISGDISALSNLTKLTVLNITRTQVSGDINALSNLTNLTVLSLSNDNNIGGDISALSNLTELTQLGLSSTNVSGEVSSLAGLTKLVYLNEFYGVSLTGDMSKIPASVVAISQDGRKFSTNFTWTAEGRQNAALLAMTGNIPFDTVSMDNMLIDQATCTFKGKDYLPWTKVISVSGTRTSASDAAVTAIQNMGVTITGVTKAS